MNRNLVVLGRVLLGLLSAAFASPAALAFGHPDAVPDWMRAAAAQTVPKYAPGTNAVVLLSDFVYTVAPDGRASERHREVIKILRPQGRDDGIVAVNFDKDRKLTSLHVWSIGPDGHEFAVKDSDIVEIGYPSSGILYDDMHLKVAHAPGRDPGGIIGY